jgi:hypothetical protein
MKRIALMQQWSDFLDGKGAAPGKVVAIGRGKR